jgi:hypothetical protein
MILLEIQSHSASHTTLTRFIIIHHALQNVRRQSLFSQHIYPPQAPRCGNWLFLVPIIKKSATLSRRVSSILKKRGALHIHSSSKSFAYLPLSQAQDVTTSSPPTLLLLSKSLWRPYLFDCWFSTSSLGNHESEREKLCLILYRDILYCIHWWGDETSQLLHTCKLVPICILGTLGIILPPKSAYFSPDSFRI